MTIRLYDSLTRTKKPLVPVRDGAVGLYVCGPTVYDDCHIGHLMGPVLFDAIARWMGARGYQVRFVNNITDIDDKIIQRAQADGVSWQDVATTYTEQYFRYLKELAVETVTDHPRCTDFVPQMVAFVEKLVAGDRAYVTSDGVYFDVQKQEGYGKLSGRRLEDALSGARVERSTELRHPADFALWKFAKAGEPSWPSPWGAGRPGWHLECSVMSTALLGDTFDIHGGGDDLKFPHHENEIAQSEAGGQEYARNWMHNGLIQYGGAKVAKSDPRMQDPEFSRQFQVAWLLETYGAPAVRFFLLQGHYRRPIDFEPKNLAAARKALRRLLEVLGPALEEATAGDPREVLTRDLPPDLAAVRDAFCGAMDDDFGTGQALAQLFTLRGKIGAAASSTDPALLLLRDLGRLLGLFHPGDLQRMGRAEEQGALLEGALRLLLDLRQQAREHKDFALSDRIRDGLTALGIEVMDGAEGATWKVKD